MSVLLASWLRSLRARDVSPATITTYRASAEHLTAFLAEQKVTQAAEVTRPKLEDWIGHLLDTRFPATASNRYRAVQQRFAWMVDEGEIDAKRW